MTGLVLNKSIAKRQFVDFFPELMEVFKDRGLMQLLIYGDREYEATSYNRLINTRQDIPVLAALADWKSYCHYGSLLVELMI